MSEATRVCTEKAKTKVMQTQTYSTVGPTQLDPRQSIPKPYSRSQSQTPDSTRLSPTGVQSPSDLCPTTLSIFFRQNGRHHPPP